ncbi:MAG: hypothetical protein HY319_09310 [Armatimonadetes bacterium]|nr:hypothetical protein [Armatimonadota bacterium]
MGGENNPDESLTWVKQMVFEPKLGGKVQVKLVGATDSPGDVEWDVRFNLQCDTTVAEVYNK